MALTLQRKLELAGDLSKLQPMLQRLHLVKKPPKRHHGRNAILVTSAIGAGAVVMVVVRRRRGRDDGALAGEDHLLAGSSTHQVPLAESDEGSSEVSAGIRST